VSQLVTGEAVALDLQTAGVPSRILAAGVDAAVQVVILIAFLFLVGASGGSEASTAALMILALVTAGLAYPVLMESLTRGRTLGKMALGIRVVRDDGGPIGARQALVRGLVGFFVERPGVTAGSAALICALLNPQGKRLGDLLAGTIVVSERVAHSHQEQVMMPPPLAGWAASLDLSQLPDELALRARAFLLRVSSLPPQSAAEIGGRLASEVAALVAPAPPPGVPAWAYLSAVVAERRRRAFGEVQPGFWPQGYGGPPPAYGGPPQAPPAPPQAPSPPPASPFAPPS
jgi:uncharacterized RDD family membrane protein YckC